MEKVPALNNHTSSKQLPMMRLSLCFPFIQELENNNIDTSKVLFSNGLSKEAISNDDVFVPAIVVYRLLESIAAAAENTFIGVEVGEKLEVYNLGPYRDAAINSKSLVDFLTRFIQIAWHDTSSSTQSLEIHQDYAIFKETRISAPEIAPSQNDAFSVAYILNIIRRGIGKHWDPKHVIAKVCTPEAIPSQYLGITITGWNRMGMSVRFPSSWLHHSIDISQLNIKNNLSTTHIDPPTDFLEALKSTIELHIDKEDFNVEYVAHLIGYSKQKLQRKLKSMGTSLSLEIVNIRKEQAIDKLMHTSISISKIAESLGFSNQASFTRAFKLWTNNTPSNYRNNIKN